MKTVFCALLLVLLVLPVSGAGPTGKPEEVGVSTERLQRITQMIKKRIDAGDLAGAVTLVARRGKVVHLVAQGVSDLDSKQPMTTGNMFRIASMTKPMVGTAIMMLVEEGKVRLNDPVSRFIPEFRNMKVGVLQPTSGRAGGTPDAPSFYTVPAQRAITIKDLLTHTSGLGSGPMGDSDIAK